MTLVDQLVEVALLGATWVLYLLFALSLVSIAAMLERIVFFRRNRRRGVGLERRIDAALADDDPQARTGREDPQALELAVSDGSIEATVLRQALAFRRGGPSAFSDAVAGAVAGQRGELDRGTTLLGTVGSNAPFVGLFGTVLGVIEAFSHLGGGDPAAMEQVMSGIAEALVATAVGIFVAIPAVVAFNVAQKRTLELENRIESLTRKIAAWLQLPPSEPDPGARTGEGKGWD